MPRGRNVPANLIILYFREDPDKMVLYLLPALNNNWWIMSNMVDPPPVSLRVAVIDDEPVIGVSCRRALGAAGHEVEYFSDPAAGLQAVLAAEFDVILLDLMMPGVSGLDLLRQIKEAGVPSEVVIITGHATIETAVEAMKLGAHDYIAKPFSPAQLGMVVNKAWEHSALVRENVALRRELEIRQGFEGIIGESRPMERVFALARRVAPTDGTVLLTGESGTGKEVFVRAIHRLSRRKDSPLMACDCSALAPTLLESELFGHVKGSFSGAIATKQGLFEAAHRGTLFLDEVANLSMETQGKLLRVLEMKHVKKVGDTAERPVDIRLVSATNRDLGEMVREGAFREDLYYRLNVVPIFLPPLRDRQGDIPLLTVSFLERFCKKNQVAVKGFSSEAMCLMESYSLAGQRPRAAEHRRATGDPLRPGPHRAAPSARGNPQGPAADDRQPASPDVGGVQAAQAAGPRRRGREPRTPLPHRNPAAV